MVLQEIGPLGVMRHVTRVSIEGCIAQQLEVIENQYSIVNDGDKGGDSSCPSSLNRGTSKRCRRYSNLPVRAWR